MNTAQEVPQAPTSKTSNVRSYFTADINQQIAEMTPKRMEGLLKELVTTPHWIALLKYEQIRMPLLDSILRSTNPTENPHMISWAQGVMAGLCDLENYVIELNSKDKQTQ